MSTIYRTSDRIKVKIGEITVKLSPLSYMQKNEVQTHLTSKNVDGLLKGAACAVKYAVKDIQGVQDSDGREYELEFEGDSLSEDCLNDLFNFHESQNLTTICMTLLDGIPKQFMDLQTGKPIKGVSIVKDGKSGKK